MKINTKFLAAAAAMLLAGSSLTVFAETAAEEDYIKTADGMFGYTLTEEGNAEIYRFLQYESYTGEVTIPSEVDGIPVTGLGEACFLTSVGVTSVTIPASVTEIGDSAFLGCTSLEKIIVEEGNPYFAVIDDGVLIADDSKFLVCYPAGRMDTSYTVPDTVDEIAPSCFAYTANLDTVVIPDSVGYIDGWAFAYSGIESIAIPDSMVQLDDYAFAYCENLTDVDLGNGLQKIYNATFAGCSALTEIELPDSLTLVGQFAFAGTGMESVTIPSSVEEISFGAFGYDINLKAISSFVIYGEANSFAQSYCTAYDVDNDYKNNFTFVDIGNPEATIAAGSTDSADAQTDSAQADDSAAEGEDPDTTETPAQDGSRVLIIVLAVCGGIAAVLAAALIVLLVRKPKDKTQEKNE